jgi:hypothetical protein
MKMNCSFGCTYIKSSSGRFVISYTNCSLFTEPKFFKHRNVIHCLLLDSDKPEMYSLKMGLN